MNLLMRRRMMMEMLSSSGLGEFTKAYESHGLQTISGNNLIITHNLGVMPKLIYVVAESDPVASTARSALIGRLIEDDPNKAWYSHGGIYYYNNTEGIATISGITKEDITDETVTVRPIYSAGRGKWSSTTQYAVYVYA